VSMVGLDCVQADLFVPQRLLYHFAVFARRHVVFTSKMTVVKL
jgi:hypothetical protein